MKKNREGRGVLVLAVWLGKIKKRREIRGRERFGRQREKGMKDE